ncbi:MAG: GNAT family N-acetyltransferase [Burkholderiaceae bacterium]|nr:GNAT family N-acetyltransferase [Burkholderiaceae bacterium]
MTDTARLVMGSWEELGAHAAAVRSEVFVREQAIPESLEWDEHDALGQHCVAFLGTRPVGTGRLLEDGRIGRMAVLAEQRRGGLGGRILERLVDAARERGDARVMLSAQTYVLAFYRHHGFVTQGDVYQEAGIDHQDMSRLLWGGAVSAQVWMVKSAIGLELRVRQWRPERGHGRGIYLLHGLGEHSGRYDLLARWLCARGWQVRAHDHAGHGESEGRRGLLERDDQLRIDALAQLAAFADELGQPPLLLGHSMGGALAAELVLVAGAPVSGLVLSSPALTLRIGAPMRWLVGLLRRLTPGLTLGNGLNAERLSHDAAVVRAYLDDPLDHDRISVRLFSWLESAGAAARKAAAGLPVQTLLLVAGDDQLVDPQGSRELAADAPAARLALHWYDAMYHELFNEISAYRQQVLDDFDRWLTARFPDPQPDRRQGEPVSGPTS